MSIDAVFEHFRGYTVDLVELLELIERRIEHHAAERQACIKAADMDMYGEHLGANDELNELHRQVCKLARRPS